MSAHPLTLTPLPPDAGESTGAAVVRGHALVASASAPARRPSRRCAASTSRSTAGRSPRSWARRARASRRCCTSWPASTAPSAGWVEIAGTRLDRLNDRDLTLLRRRQVGFVFQSYNLLPVLSAEENITLPLRIGGDAASIASGSTR